MNAVGSTGDHIGVNTGEINKDYLTNKHTKVSAVQVDDVVMSLAKGAPPPARVRLTVSTL